VFLFNDSVNHWDYKTRMVNIGNVPRNDSDQENRRAGSKSDPALLCPRTIYSTWTCMEIMWMVIRIFDLLEWTEGLPKRHYTRHSVSRGNIFIWNFTDVVKEPKFGPVISALRSMRGYSTFNRRHIRDLDGRTHRQT